MLLFTIILIPLYPSLRLTQVIKVASPVELPNQFEVGEVFFLSFHPQVTRPSITSTSLTPLSKKQLWFGSVGLPDGDSILIHGGVLRSHSPGLGGHPKEYYFSKKIPVAHTIDKKPSQLRLSDNVWDRVDDTHEAKKKEQAQVMKELLSKVSDGPSLECWQRPLRSVRTSRFASPRSLPNGDSYYHTGVDRRARTPTPIPSAGRGHVVFADHMIVPGNVVVVDHGGGLFSRYMHLSEFHVQKGDFVEKGQPLGLSGSTGRVEAPHLHWEVVWKGHFASPLQFLQDWEQICDPE